MSPLILQYVDSSVLVRKRVFLAEVRRREFYEKPTAERKRKSAAAVKRLQKKLARERYALKNLRRGRPQV
jgi:SSU ribosomal protein S21P